MVCAVNTSFIDYMVAIYKMKKLFYIYLKMKYAALFAPTHIWFHGKDYFPYPHKYPRYKPNVKKVKEIVKTVKN